MLRDQPFNLQIDLLVGSLAESPLPSGFGFSDTFFRIFVLMARRRLESDRFFTDDYTPELYTQWGLDYIDQTWMKQILLRHHPSFSDRFLFIGILLFFPNMVYSINTNRSENSF
jgi:hypothetical protein